MIRKYTREWYFRFNNASIAFFDIFWGDRFKEHAVISSIPTLKGIDELVSPPKNVLSNTLSLCLYLGMLASLLLCKTAHEQTRQAVSDPWVERPIFAAFKSIFIESCLFSGASHDFDCVQRRVKKD